MVGLLVLAGSAFGADQRVVKTQDDCDPATFNAALNVAGSQSSCVFTTRWSAPKADPASASNPPTASAAVSDAVRLERAKALPSLVRDGPSRAPPSDV